MKKYILYRVGLSIDDEDQEIMPDQESELVAVEFGNELDHVLEDLLRDVRDDLAGMDEYAGCNVDAHGPLDNNYDLPPFDFLGVVAPPYAEKNILWDYSVEVEEQ